MASDTKTKHRKICIFVNERRHVLLGVELCSLCVVAQRQNKALHYGRQISLLFQYIDLIECKGTRSNNNTQIFFSFFLCFTCF